MKRPLPLFEQGPRKRLNGHAAQRLEPVAPAERLRVPQLLVCIHAAENDTRAERFATSLVSALRAIGSGAALAVAASPQLAEPAEAAWRDAGADPILRVAPGARASFASALASVSLERPVLAVGAALCAELHAALRISLSQRPPNPDDSAHGVELWLGRDGEGIAKELAPLLAFAARQRGRARS